MHAPGGPGPWARPRGCPVTPDFPAAAGPGPGSGPPGRHACAHIRLGIIIRLAVCKIIIRLGIIIRLAACKILLWGVAVICPQF